MPSGGLFGLTWVRARRACGCPVPYCALKVPGRFVAWGLCSLGPCVVVLRGISEGVWSGETASSACLGQDRAFEACFRAAVVVQALVRASPVLRRCLLRGASLVLPLRRVCPWFICEGATCAWLGGGLPAACTVSFVFRARAWSFRADICVDALAVWLGVRGCGRGKSCECQARGVTCG